MLPVYLVNEKREKTEARKQGRGQRARAEAPRDAKMKAKEPGSWRMVAGGAEDALLAEAAALVAEATDGAEEFGETLADMTDGIITRGASARPKPREARRSRFIRSVPRRAS